MSTTERLLDVRVTPPRETHPESLPLPLSVDHGWA